jgi:hypothetical protein
VRELEYKQKKAQKNMEVFVNEEYTKEVIQEKQERLEDVHALERYYPNLSVQECGLPRNAERDTPKCNKERFLERLCKRVVNGINFKRGSIFKSILQLLRSAFNVNHN